MPLRRHPVAWSHDRDVLAAIPLDDALVARLRRVYDRVRNQDSRLAQRFYDKLFRACPTLRRLFPDDLDRQAEKLMASLDVVIDHLDQPEENARYLMELGARHASYGVKPEDYCIVVDLFIESMQEILGPEASAGGLDEWRTALRLISNHMIAAAGSLD